MLLRILDAGFIIFHSALTIFNSTGWIFRRTRKLHLITISLTAFSWFILGIWYGWGYCLCTDWHWQVREALGRPITSYSYIHFLLYELTGINFSPKLVDTATALVFFLSTAATILLNIRDYRKSKMLS